MTARSTVPARRAGDNPAGTIFTAVKRLALRALFLSLLVLGATAAPAGAATPRVLTVEFANDVNPVTADYVTSQIDRANREHYDAIVIELDTPGGLSTAMKDIYQAELNSKVPVIVYVSPAGSRAASAGVWIGQAADILAMAPQTNIGSSTPIDVGGGDIQKDLRRKVINDAAASLRTLARNHDRNEVWAELAVRKASNLTEYEALKRNVIDVVAPTLPALLNTIDGTRTVPKGIVLHTADAEVTEVHMSLWKRILDTLIDPNIILLLMSLGVLGITVEIFNPGLIFPGTIGALVAHHRALRPAGAAGQLGGGAADAARGRVLRRRPLPADSRRPDARWARELRARLADALRPRRLCLPGVAVGRARDRRDDRGPVRHRVCRRSSRRGVPSRRPARRRLIGEIGVVRRALDPEGVVFVHGELWRARSDGGRDPGRPTGSGRRGRGRAACSSVSPVAEPAPAPHLRTGQT